MSLKAFRYHFPLKNPFITGAGTFSKREGIIFILEKDGISAYGEAAPLPGFSGETLDQVIEQLYDNRSEIKKEVASNLAGHSTSRQLKNELFPSLQFAFDTLAMDFHAKRNHTSLRNELFEHPNFKIPVNAALSIDDVGATLQQAGKLWKEGYRTFKVKVGVDFEQELEIIEQLRKRYPQQNIRIDANQSWTPEQAEEYLDMLSRFTIEYCEEPVLQPGLKVLQQLHKKSAVPVALDESLQQLGPLEDILKEPLADILIIKPMVFGGVQKNFETIRLLVSHGYTAVFTTSLESGIGRMMTANLASGLGATHLAQGLATGSLLTMDVWHDRTYINSGYFNLPDGPGLGEEHRPDIQDLALKPIVF